MRKLTRRELLKGSLAGVGAALLASCASPTPTPKPAATAVPTPVPPTPTPAGPITLRILYYGGAGSAHYDEFAKRYSEESGGRITVELETSPGDMATKQELGLVSGTLADLVRSDTSYWPYLAQRGAFLVIEDYVKDAGMDLSGWFNIEWFRKWTGGKLSGLGGESGINNCVMLYNKPWVLEAWGKEPTEEWTFDDYVECMSACVALKGGKGNGSFGSNYGPLGGYHVHDGWVKQWGGRYMTDDGKTETFTDPKTQDAVKWLMDQIATGNYPTRADLAADGEAKMFYAGKIAMVSMGPGGVGGTMSAAKDAGIDVGWVMMPRGPSYFETPSRRAFTPFSNPLAIYSGTKYPAETFELLRRITSLEAHKWVTMLNGRQPGAQLASWYDPDVAERYPWFPIIADWMKECKDVFPCPANTRFPEWATLGNQLIPQLVYGDMPYTDASIKSINDQLQDVLDQPVPESIAKKE